MSSNASDPTARTRGYSLVLISAALLSTTAILISYLTRTYQLPALVLAFWRDVFVVATLLLALMVIRPRLLRLPRGNLLFLVGFGLLLSFFNAFWTLSVAINGAAVSTVLAYSSAAFAVFLGYWLLKERLTWPKLLAVGLSIVGCVLVSEALDPAAWAGNSLGILVGVVTGFFYATYSLMGRAASQRGIDPWSTLLYTFGFAACFLLFVNLLPVKFFPGTAQQPSDLFWLGDAFAGWVLLFLLGAGPTVGGFGIYNVSLVYLPSSVASLVLTLEPAFTAVTAYLLLGERLSLVQIGGSLLIMTAVVVLRIFEERRKRHERRAGSPRPA
jgi:drug/metabolite transporter (DMT)-like permease